MGGGQPPGRRNFLHTNRTFQFPFSFPFPFPFPFPLVSAKSTYPELRDPKDIYMDDMGSWRYNGVYKLWVSVDSDGFMVSHGKEKPSMTVEGTHYHNNKEVFLSQNQWRLKKDCCHFIRYCLL